MNFDYQGIWGVDISTYQDSPLIAGHIDFQMMKDGGVRFVIIKASQGNFEDIDFDINWLNSKGLLPHSPYHYYDNGVAPKLQGLRFWDTIRHDMDGICWFDLEDGSEGPYGKWKYWYDCIAEFQRLSGLPDNRIGIYTRRSYWIERTVTATYEEKRWFGKFHLWLANYPPDPFNPDYSKILVPFPWMDEDVILLQLGTPAIGLALGVESREIDYNRFNGNEEEFKIMFGDISPGEPMEITLTANLKSGEQSRVRSAPNLSGNIITTMTGPLSIQGVGQKTQADGYYWIQIISPHAGFVALTTSYENVVYTPPTTPAEDHLEIFVNGVKTLDMTGKINAG